jgi:hypothetical protein
MGRPRKTNVRRDASGKSRGEEGIHPETLTARERRLREAGVPLTFRKMEMTKLGWREVTKRTATDRMSGFTLGILRLRGKGDPGGISEEQFNAGDGFCRIVHQHAAVMGYRLSVPSPSLMLIGLGGSSHEDDAETIARVRRRFQRCFDALMEASRADGKRVWQVTYGVCVENWSPGQLSAEDFGSLRTGLNALRKVV